MKNRFFWMLIAILLSGCTPAMEEKRRYFWPPPPGEARIEYLNFFISDRDLLRGHENRLADIVLGIEKPKSLFTRPIGAASGNDRRVFVTDQGLGKVLVLDMNTGYRRFLADAEGDPRKFRFPFDVAVDVSGQVYVTDPVEHQIIVFGADEREKTVISHPLLVRPNGICVDSSRRKIYIADTGAHQITTFDFDGQFLGTFGLRGKLPGQFNFPLDVAIDSEGHVFVLDSLNARIQVFDGEWNFIRQFGQRGSAEGSFTLPKSLAVSPSGHVYVTDQQANRFLVFDRDGNHLISVGGRYVLEAEKISPGGFNAPAGIAIDANETIWIVDTLNRMLHSFQYLNDDFKAGHPILPGQAIIPPEVQETVEFVESAPVPLLPDGGKNQ